jgi:exo-beta-1,3-glucanase (GH17 family)
LGYFVKKLIYILALFFLSCTCFAKPFFGVSYGPYRAGQAPGGTYPSLAQIEEDISIISQMSRACRNYGIDNTLNSIPDYCHTYDVDCYVGSWLSGTYPTDQTTIADLIDIAGRGYSTTKAIIVGNEYVYGHGSSGVSYLEAFLDQVNAATDIPVTTGEPAYVWLDNPSLVSHVDFIGIHVYGYWNGVDIADAAQEVVDQYNEVKAAYPSKEVMILETGWPTQGDTHYDAVPSVANQEIFLKEFSLLARQHNIKYFMFAAFDEPWKGAGVESNWGLYYEDRTTKSSTQAFFDANPADIDFSGSVDTTDLAMQAFDWLISTDPNDLTLPGDRNQDNITDYTDLAVTFQNWLWTE